MDLDLEIKNPFLRYVDDYLIFCKEKDDPQRLLKELILPKLKELGLELNEKKLSSGRFHRDKLNFIGFDFYAGYFQINKNKIEEFKKKIIKLTHLTREGPKETIIKSLNNQVLGFGHYYKIASCKKEFEVVDAFTRQRLRRWLIKNKDQKQKIGNLYLANLSLKNLGLKSLTDILTKYATKKRLIFLKLKKRRGKISKTGKFSKSAALSNLTKISGNIDKIWYYSLLKELKEIVKRLSNIERKIAKIEIKLEREKSDKINGKE